MWKKTRGEIYQVQILLLTSKRKMRNKNKKIENKNEKHYCFVFVFVKTILARGNMSPIVLCQFRYCSV